MVKEGQKGDSTYRAQRKAFPINKQEDARRRLRGMCGFQKELRVCWMEMEVE